MGNRLDRFAMLIVCPSCASEYTLDPERIGNRGRKVRCAVCRGTWFVRKPEHADSDMRVGESGGASAGSPPTIEAVPDGYPAPAGSQAHLPPSQRGIRSDSNRTRERLAVAAILFLLVAAPSAIALRQRLVAQVPSTSTLFEAIGLPVNLVSLELLDVSAAVEQDGGARVLLIEGEIRATGPHSVSVPRLDFAIEDGHGAGLYSWSANPPVGELGPGESARFTARLASPPPDGARLVASFQTERGDQSVALR